MMLQSVLVVALLRVLSRNAFFIPFRAWLGEGLHEWRTTDALDICFQPCFFLRAP